MGGILTIHPDKTNPYLHLFHQANIQILWNHALQKDNSCKKSEKKQGTNNANRIIRALLYILKNRLFLQAGNDFISHLLTGHQHAAEDGTHTRSTRYS